MFGTRKPAKYYLAVAGVATACLWLSLRLIDPLPPRRIALASGPNGSLLHEHAQRYREALAREGVELAERQTEGVEENLRLLADPHSGVDIAFVQGGQAREPQAAGIVMIASLYYQPLWIVMRRGQAVDTLTALAGKRIATGMPGSGSHALGVPLLAASGVTAGNSTLLDMPTAAIAAALERHQIDAALAVGGVNAPALRELLGNPGLELVSLAHADAFVQRYRFLSKRTLFAGAIDFVPLRPARDVTLVATEAMLAAREDINPSLVNLLLETIRDTHDDQSYFEAAGEFPNVEQVDLPVSPDAIRHQRFGPSLLYRYLPFWAATAVERFIIIVVPLLAILVPVVRLLPSVVAWRVRARIYRWYGELALLERDVDAHSDPAPIRAWLDHLHRLERAAERLDAPSSFASEVYTLREHIELVRRAVLARAAPAAGA